MTWYVKAKDANGTVYPILCDTQAQVSENIADQRARGREVWIEDVSGRKIDESSFDPVAARDAFLDVIERLADPNTIFPAGKEVGVENIAKAMEAVKRLQKFIDQSEAS